MVMNPWFTLHKYLLRGYSRFPVFSSLSMDDSLHLCIMSPSSFKYLSMEILSLCSALRCPGSMINDAAGNPIRNPGIPMSALAERRLKVVIYIARLYSHGITCILTPVMITKAEVRVS